MLAERNTDDGNAPKQARDQKTEGKTEAAEDKPNDVCNGMLAEVTGNGLAERPKAEPCHFKRLCSKGDADDGDAPKQADDKPTDCRCKTCEDEPKNVADKFHDVPPEAVKIRSADRTIIIMNIHGFVNMF